jgi:hypothetical protein
MRALALVASVLFTAGCDLNATDEITLDLVGTVRNAEGLPFSGAELALGGVFVENEDLITPLRITASDGAGNYALSYTLPSLGVGPNGECIAMARSGEVRVVVTGGDGHGLYATAYPQCTGDQQRVDLDLAPISGGSP